MLITAPATLAIARPWFVSEPRVAPLGTDAAFDTTGVVFGTFPAADDHGTHPRDLRSLRRLT